ncbi:hypothetical protein DZC31_23070 [Stenotrophomonas rhizophila]|nr:hypothetical protein DZC31_23070 [Stenotrophomonas rhizophila]
MRGCSASTRSCRQTSIGSNSYKRLEANGAALQPFRDTRPLLQGNANFCRSGLVSRKGRKAAPVS